MYRVFYRTKGIKSESGLTLIEVLASMVVLTLGILAMAPMLVLSITGNQYSSQVTELATEAQLKIEEQVGRGSFPMLPYYDYSHSEDYKYAMVTEVSDNTVDGSIPANLYQIAVSVYWMDEDVYRTMRFTTYSNKP